MSGDNKHLFSGFPDIYTYPNLKEIIGQLDTSLVSSMRGFFYKAISLESVDLSSYDTSQVTSMVGMFNSVKIKELDLKSFNTLKVTTMEGMFINNQVLETLDLSSFNTSQVTDMSQMFQNTFSLESLDLSNFDTSKVSKMSNMFDKSGVNTLVLGEKSIFNSTVNLPAVNSSGIYSGGWICVENGNRYDSSNAFMTDYDGTIPGTYVWELKSIINAEDITIYQNSDYDPNMSYIDAFGGLGQNLDMSELTIDSSAVNTGVPGVYPVTFSHNGTTVTVNVRVVADYTALAVKDSTIYVGTPWSPEDNFVSATDIDGNAIDFSQVTTTGTVDTTTPGSYTVTYSYGGITKTATITVLEDKTSIEGKDSTIYTGTPWSPEDNFVSATDRDGNAVDFSKVTVSGTVNTSVPGDYEITYSYTDPVTGKKVDTTVMVTVTQDQETLVVKDSTIYVGTPWSPEDNFVSATDKDGNMIDFSQVVVSGTVDNLTPGSYEVTYSYSGLTQTATITVLEDKTSIEGKDSTIYTDTPWSPEDNFVSATDRDGNLVDFSKVTVSGTVNTSVPGDYEITYSYTDPITGKKVDTTVTVTVTQDQETLVVKDSTIYVGTPWSPEDNFVSATDKDGNMIDFSQVVVSGTVDNLTPGSYEVTYSYGGLTQTATITVLANQTSVEGKDSTIMVGSSWSPEDNFVSATDKDGNIIDFSEVTVSGTVDTTTPGDYEITYSYGGQSITITVTVVAEEPEKPVTPPTPVVPTKPEKPTAPAVPTNLTKPVGRTQSNSALPKAGEERMEATLLSLLGIGLAAGAAWFISMSKRKKHENETK